MYSTYCKNFKSTFVKYNVSVSVSLLMHVVCSIVLFCVYFLSQSIYLYCSCIYYILDGLSKNYSVYPVACLHFALRGIKYGSCCLRC